MLYGLDHLSNNPVQERHHGRMPDLGTEPPRPTRSGAETTAHLPAMEGSTPTMNGLEPLMSIEGLSEYLDVPVRTLHDWRPAGKGPCAVHVGRQLRYFVTDVNEWLRQQRGATRPGSGSLLRRRWR
jgi:hypothetical protein